MHKSLCGTVRTTYIATSDTFGIQQSCLLRVATTDNDDTFLCDSCAILIPLTPRPTSVLQLWSNRKYSTVTLDATMSIVVKFLFLWLDNAVIHTLVWVRLPPWQWSPVQGALATVWNDSCIVIIALILWLQSSYYSSETTSQVPCQESPACGKY